MVTEPNLEPESECPCAFVAGLTNLYCNDVEAALRFYAGLLGFTETFRTPTNGVPEHVEVALANGFKLGLSSVEAARRVHGVNASPGSPSMAITVWTDDTDQAFVRLVEAGVPVVQQPHDTVNNNRAALLRDPDGNLVEIVAKVTRPQVVESS
jgi:catechol 2,3-dioxygenase-like lactoylglutathione lyase family enzyme